MNDKEYQQLINAVRTSRIDVLSSLLKSNNFHVNDILKQDERELRLLHYAAEAGDDICEWLINHGAVANVSNYKGFTPLHVAVYNQLTNSVKLFLEAGADINASNYEGYTSMHIAAQHCDEKMIEMLITYGAIVDSLSDNLKTPLSMAAACGKTQIAKMLIRHGANINNFSSKKNTPLHYAARNGRVEIVELLLNHGAKANIPNMNGATPLMLSLKSIKAEAIQSLLLKKIENTEDFSLDDITSYTRLKSLWNSKFNAERYDEFTKKYNLYKYTSNAILDLLEFKAGCHVLDLATGTGIVTQTIHQKWNDKCKIIAVDRSEAMLHKAKENLSHPSIKYILSEAENVHTIIKKQTIDIVICNASFWQMNMRKTFEAISSVLTANGLFVFNLPKHFLNNHLLSNAPVNKNKIKRSDLLDFAKEFGLALVKEKTITYSWNKEEFNALMRIPVMKRKTTMIANKRRKYEIKDSIIKKDWVIFMFKCTPRF